MSSGTKESDAYHLAEERGCYVFAMRNRGLNPIYVGKATRCFKQETFNPGNRQIPQRLQRLRQGNSVYVLRRSPYPKRPGEH